MPLNRGITALIRNFLVLAMFWASSAFAHSGAEKPWPTIFSTFPYAYWVGREVEVGSRHLRHLVSYFDWDRYEKSISSTDWARFPTDNYLTSEAAQADLNARDPILYAKLSKGVDEGNYEFFKLLRPGERSQPRTVQGRLILPSRVSVLNARWNALPLTERLGKIRLGLLDPVLLSGLIHRSAKDLFWAEQAPDALKALEFESFEDYVELRDRFPYASAKEYFAAWDTLMAASRLDPQFRQPLNLLRADAGYHVHFSVDSRSRAESLEPILKAWNHLILFKMVEAGILDVFTHDQVGFERNLRNKGFVRLVDSHHVELRVHFTDPKTELAMFMELVALSNEEAVRKVYNQWMPKLNRGQVLWLAELDPTEFKMLLKVPQLRKSLGLAQRSNLVADVVQLLKWGLSPKLINVYKDDLLWSSASESETRRFVATLASWKERDRGFSWVYLVARFEADSEKLLRLLNMSDVDWYHEYALTKSEALALPTEIRNFLILKQSSWDALPFLHYLSYREDFEPLFGQIPPDVQRQIIQWAKSRVALSMLPPRLLSFDCELKLSTTDFPNSSGNDTIR